MKADSSKTDLMYEILYNWDFVPKPSPKVNVSAMVIDDKQKYFMKNHIMGTLYELDESSYTVWSLLDGKRSMGQILEDTQKTKSDIKPVTVLQTILFFAESGALQSVLEPIKKSRVKIESSFKVYVTIVESSKNFLESIHKLIRPFLRRELLWASIAFVVFMGLAFAGQFVGILGDKTRFEILGSTVVGLLIYNFVILAPVTAIHEIAHGLTVVHYGGKPKDMGTGWFYFGPMFYCDATDAWTFSRRHRMMVMLAGNLSTMLIGSAIVVVLYVWPFPSYVSTILSMTAFWCFYTSLWNFAPPFETDGYWVLADLLKMPNLRHDAYTYLKTVVKRALKRPVEEVQGLTSRRKAILLGYAVMSVVWLTYMAYQSSTLMSYYARDAATSFVKISSSVLFNQALSALAFGVSIASIVYFTMMITGYGFIFATAIKKAATRTLHFEAIHDRDLSVFLSLPTQVSDSLAKELRTKMANAAKKFTSNFSVTRVGSLYTATLRLGGKELALVQIKEHLRKIEREFTSMYQKLLQHHKDEILGSNGTYAPGKNGLTHLLTQMGRELTKTGSQEAKGVVKEVLRDQTRDVFYLLNSTSGRVWTVELPPAQQSEVKKILSSLSVEDLAVTDLYDEVEDFKKRTIYGFDSLAKLFTGSQEDLLKTFEQPEEHQAMAFFQPVKGRIIIVGRTEQIEKKLDCFGCIFVDQVWCGYMDSLLSETNQVLSALSQTLVPDKDEIQRMSDGELTVLSKNLAALTANGGLVENVLHKCEESVQSAKSNLKELRSDLEELGVYKTGSFDDIVAVNVENLRNLPNRLKHFKEQFQSLRAEVADIKELAQAEHHNREVVFAGKKRRTTRMYPLFALFSVVLAFVGFQPFMQESMRITFLAAALFVQLVYGILYTRVWRSFHTVNRYSSSAFTQLQVFVFALAQTYHKFVSTGDLVTPMSKSNRNATR